MKIKLSAAIEQAITSGKYNTCDEYMCCVLKSMRLEYHVAAVQDMVAEVAQGQGMPGQPLVCALSQSTLCSFNLDVMSWPEAFQYTKQFYCWYVFDLKRKGL